MRLLVLTFVIFYSFLGFCSPESVSYRTIRIVGRADSVVTKPEIQLGDITDISSPRTEDDSNVLALRKLKIIASPNPGESAVISGQDIIERMHREGVNFDKLGYNLPPELKVTRAYREVSLNEVERAVTDLITNSGREIQVKKIEYSAPIKVAPNALPIRAIGLREAHSGHMAIDFESQNEGNQARYQLRALVDEWKMIAVAKRLIAKSETVTGADVEMRSYNAALIGRDAISEPSLVLGAVATRDIGQGEVFRSNTVKFAPVVAKDSKVILRFKSGLLEATATGIAIESGSVGQEIKVRNESSKKVLSGRVIETGLVSVGG